jgi:hypothetical protein
MIHYHFWFTLKPAIPEADGLATARSFIKEVTDRGDAARALLLRNSGEAPKSRLPRYHALFEFVDDVQMERAFAAKRTEGIHAGPHGRLMEAIDGRQVEVFREV